MRVVDVVNNRTQEVETITVEAYEMQRNHFLPDIKDALYVPKNNIYYDVPDEVSPVVEAKLPASGEEAFAEWTALQAKKDEITYQKLSGEEKARYQELKTLFNG
jgi:hypothetical protein